MAIDFRCPHCDESYSISSEKAGKRFRCKLCGEPISVPTGTMRSSQGRSTAGASRSRRGTASTRSRRKPQESEAGNNTLIFVSIGAAAVTTLVIIGILVVAFTGGEDQPKAADANAKPNDDAARKEMAAVEDAPKKQPEAAKQKQAAKEPAAAVHAPPPEGELELLEEWTYAKIEALKPQMKKDVKSSSTLGQSRTDTSIVAEVTYYVNIEYSHPESTRGIMIYLSSHFSGLDPNYKNRAPPTGEKGTTRFYQRLTSETPLYYTQFLPEKRTVSENMERTGVTFRSYENGMPRSKGNYEAGKRNGEFVCWDRDGNRIWQGTYVKGLLDDSKVFAADEKVDRPEEVLFDPTVVISDIKWIEMEALFDREDASQTVLPKLMVILNFLRTSTNPAWVSDSPDYMSRLVEIVEKADRADLPEIPVAQAVKMAQDQPEGGPVFTIAAHLIAKHGEKAVDELLKPLEESPNSLVPPISSESITLIGSEAGPAVPALLQSLKIYYIADYFDNPAAARERLWSALAAIGPESLPPIVELIRQYDGSFIISQKKHKVTKSATPVADALKAIGKMKTIDEETTKLLIDIAKNQDRKRKWPLKAEIAAAGALSKHDPETGVTYLLNIIKREAPNWSVKPGQSKPYVAYRAGSIRLLGEAGREAERGIPLLQKIAQDENSLIRAEAALLLAKLSESETEKAISVLVECLDGSATLGFNPLDTEEMRLIVPLGEFGPAAKSAIPAISQIRAGLQNQLDEYLKIKERKGLGTPEGTLELIQRFEGAIKIIDEALSRIEGKKTVEVN